MKSKSQSNCIQLKFHSLQSNKEYFVMVVRGDVIGEFLMMPLRLIKHFELIISISFMYTVSNKKKWKYCSWMCMRACVYSCGSNGIFKSKLREIKSSLLRVWYKYCVIETHSYVYLLKYIYIICAPQCN